MNLKNILNCTVIRLLKFKVIAQYLSKYRVQLMRQNFYVEDAEMTFYRNKLVSYIFCLIVLMISLSLFKGILCFYGLVCAVGITFYHDLKLREWNKKTLDDIYEEMPVMIMSIKLLIIAGMPTVKAIERSTKNGQISLCIGKINTKVINGSSLVKSYMFLANRLQLPSVTRFCRIVIQDEKHGSKETIQLLDKLLDDLWKQRKTNYLKRGEEASTKLLIPMMMALVSILVAMMVPALSQLLTVV